MKINQVKQYIASNISRFEKDKNNCHARRLFHLYDKNNSYRGEHLYSILHSSGYTGVKTSMSTTSIMSNKLKQEMQEIVYINKEFVDIYDPESKELLKTKALPTEITTITTVLDFINDQFKTVRSVSKLKNKLQRINKNNTDVIYSDNFVIYEPLKEKPHYEKLVEYTREGSISEAKKKTLTHKINYPLWGSINQIPYKFW